MTNREGIHIMSTWKSMLLAGTIALTPVALPAAATAREAPEAEVVAADDRMTEADVAAAKEKAQREMDAALAMIEKIFDTSDLPPIEPARLTLAQQTTAALIPAGSLEKMMDNLYGKMFSTVMDEFAGTSDLMLSIKTGVESDKIATLDEKSKEAIADMLDPHRKERESQITGFIKPLISEALADLERPMREGLAKAYARKFSAAQLTEMNGFFATPTGTAFAGESLALQADPEVMLAMVKAIPPMVVKFIDRAPEIEGQFKDLPKERELADFSDKDLAKLAKLLKTDVKTLKENRDMWSAAASDDDYAVDAAAEAADAAADAAAASAEAAADAVDAAVEWDPAFDRSNWSEADLQRVEAAEAAAYEAEQKAIENARKRNPSP